MAVRWTSAKFTKPNNQKLVLAGNGSAYLCKGKINERNFGISIISLGDKMNV